ncbi:hypothetical protein EVAR_439_1 [Eumeta japonica]|uniref:Uncharacterized protein n=1 Tax=Eumeta variegata TaxID=151549 RepID=A0A4C1SCI2_EUMVA|nr:hypothetical protein EVAR_439_1 [Eumeta japonica]
MFPANTVTTTGAMELVFGEKENKKRIDASRTSIRIEGGIAKRLESVISSTFYVHTDKTGDKNCKYIFIAKSERADIVSSSVRKARPGARAEQSLRDGKVHLQISHELRGKVLFSLSFYFESRGSNYESSAAGRRGPRPPTAAVLYAVAPTSGANDFNLISVKLIEISTDNASLSKPISTIDGAFYVEKLSDFGNYRCKRAYLIAGAQLHDRADLKTNTGRAEPASIRAIKSVRELVGLRGHASKPVTAGPLLRRGRPLRMLITRLLISRRVRGTGRANYSSTK